MIQSVEISNFKGLSDVKLKDLARINVVVGDNGSGKTSLLESLFMTAGLGPEIYFRLRLWRGSGEKVIVAMDRDQYEAIWQELFLNLDQNKVITTKFIDSNQGERRLKIFYDVSQSTLMPLDLNVKTAYESGDIHPISFSWKTDAGGEETIVVSPNPSPTPTASPLPLNQIKHVFPMTFFATTSLYSPEENAKRFSFLNRRHKSEGVVRVIKSLFPIVKDLSVELVAGFPGIYASVEDFDEMVSIGSISGGLAKYVGLLLGIAAMPKGVVLIDEVENGFFYKRFPELWRSLAVAAQENETQLFISTHSIECVQAALPLVSEHPGWFSLLRTERKDGRCKVRQFSGRDFFAALEQGTEFR